ncbi:MAG: DMT family transporter [Alphaproteobacteria bacterium]
MTLEPLLVGLVLLSAVIHAVWNAMVKASGDRLLSVTCLMTPPALMGLAIAIWAPLPPLAVIPFLLFSGLSYSLHYAALLAAYRHGDLSQAYPIARGSGPLFVALLSAPVAGEFLSPLAWLGILAICGGILALALRRRGVGAPLRGITYALLVGLTIAAYSFSDALGARLPQDPFSYIGWMLMVQLMPLLTATLVARRRLIAPFLKRNGWRSLLGGTLAGFGYAVVVWAYSQGTIAPIAALRETSVIFAAVIGTLLLGEPFGRWRVAAAAMVAAGIVLLNLEAVF